VAKEVLQPTALPMSIQFCMTLYAPDFLLPRRWLLGSMPSQEDPFAFRQLDASDCAFI
jgi:hypothetical protein